MYQAGVPVLGICYGAQLLAQQLGGEVSRSGVGEYGRTALDIVDGSILFNDFPPRDEVWMSHADSIVVAPPGFRVTARTASVPVAALEDPERRVYGVQFHPEVVHTSRGQQLLKDQLIAQEVFDQRHNAYAVAQSTLKASQARISHTLFGCSR